MERKTKTLVLCIFVAILGLITTFVGLAFEVVSNQQLDHMFYLRRDENCTGENCWKCLYFRSTAFYMVVVAIVCLLIAQMIINISVGCGCCKRVCSSSALQALAILTNFFSWLACITAVILYLIGGAKQYGAQIPEVRHFSSLNNNIPVNNTQCYRVKHGMFGAAAALSFSGVTLGIISYLALRSSKNYATHAHISTPSSDD